MDLSTESYVIYVRLLDEGINVMRPVDAERISDDEYFLIKPSNYNPEEETWEFQPESHVRCERRRVGDEVVLVANNRMEQCR